MATVTFRGSRAELTRLLRLAAAIAAGRVSDPTGVALGLQLRVGVAALSQVEQDFVVKSRGGTGVDGVRWPPLTRATIAARRVTPGERKAAGIKGRRVRGLLTPAQDRRWRAIFASRLARLRLLGVPGAKGIAARIAWAVLKSEGAQTRLAVFGGRQVDIGRDTGRMFRSLSAGVEDRPSGEAEQIFRAFPGRVIVGSNVPYFPKFNAKRQVLPRGNAIPQAYWPAIRAAAQRGLMAIVTKLVELGVRP